MPVMLTSHEVVATVLRPGGRDRFGNPLPDVTHDIPGCLFGPRSSSEASDFANTVITGAQLFLPAGSDLEASDRVRVRGVVYAVEGDVGDWGAAGMQVALQGSSG